MPQAVLALGVAAVTASGCVWYMPALADLRAGADRPVSRRRAAAACVSGWSTAGTVAVLLLLAEAWWIPRAAAVVGGLVSAGLRIRAAVLRRNEAGETARQWSELGHGRPLPATDRSRYVVAVLIGIGLAAAAVTAVVRVAAGPEDAADRLAAVAAPAAVLGLFLTIAVTHTRMARRRTRTDRARPPQ
ncbi:hypothetical protein [Streptomyces chiangmaiensis]|uniref:Secreted protein n=1 Tax=Streptomyces chiangmaiensis TaxID=766497 RepID=A0ABU7FPQ4_9ACTN|nr:hypothetical protein [Streptomyces chiangmaiensis]MED7825408.1 hypothetical protein [Streptomyces chiangmaiensis]